MSEGTAHPVWNLMGLLFKAHPWHGVAIGSEAPRRLTAYIEIVPADTVKFEIDKVNGYLRIDRPQQFSNICPSLYGLIPQTLCAERVAALCMEKTGREGIVGDGDPLDICVLTEKSLSHGDVLVEAIPIGGLRLIDGDEADDKIVAVLKGDAVYGGVDDIANCPQSVLERLKHYFLTYKQDPESPQRKVEIDGVYGAAEAHEVIARSQQDYQARFAGIYLLLKG